jgi:hypothetical protein
VEKPDPLDSVMLFVIDGQDEPYAVYKPGRVGQLRRVLYPLSQLNRTTQSQCQPASSLKPFAQRPGSHAGRAAGTQFPCNQPRDSLP